jgi:alkylated DNA repair protein alkB homolog 6
MAGTGSTGFPRVLEQFRISRLPETAYYIPDFISKDEEALLLDRIASAPKPRWKQLTRRRLQAWPSELVQDRLLEAPLPDWLKDPVVTRIMAIPMSDTDHTRLFEHSPNKGPNHVLINEYPPGVGIMPHKVSRLDQ